MFHRMEKIKKFIRNLSYRLNKPFAFGNIEENRPLYFDTINNCKQYCVQTEVYITFYEDSTVKHNYDTK